MDEPILPVTQTESHGEAMTADNGDLVIVGNVDADPVSASEVVDVQPALTPDEEADIVSDARTFKAEDDAQAQRRANPGSYVGLDAAEQGVYEYRQMAANKARTLLVDGVDFEHADTDADGVWLYRHMS